MAESPRQGVRHLMKQGASFSGHEHNRLYMQTMESGTRQFLDRSLVSGADAEGDGRAFAQMDWDHDGDVDLVVVNANAPRVELFENQVGADMGQALWLDLRGATGASNRDGIGARVVLDTANGPQSAEKRAGEGFASQNTGWLHFGLGSLPGGKGLRVYWPSGRETKVEEPLEAGARYRVYEDLSESPTRSNLERIP